MEANQQGSPVKWVLVSLAVVAAIAFLAGYRLAPREILDEEVSYAGPMTVDTRRVLSATVDSLKRESKLVSYSHRASTKVSITRDKWMLFEGHQELMVPADVSYFIDLSKLQQDDVEFDEAAKTVRVRLPRMMMDVAFDPQGATEINQGTLTFNDSVVQELRKLNYQQARKAIIKQSQQAELVRSAKANAVELIASVFRIPLSAVGKNDLKIEVTVEGRDR
jgi:Protein of unknown function (DUF4230)